VDGHSPGDCAKITIFQNQGMSEKISTASGTYSGDKFFGHEEELEKKKFSRDFPGNYFVSIQK